MENLGDYLVLLSITSDKGTIATAQRIGYGLMGAELVGLAASGRIDIQRDRICVRDPSPTGDAELDTALASLVRARRAPRTQAWVGRPRRGIVQAYLNRLAAAGMVRAERRFLGTRHVIADPVRARQVRARLDAIALSAGMVATEQAAFGGLVHAIALDGLLYPGRAGWPVRKRLLEMGRGQWTVAAVTGAVSSAATQAANQAAAHAAAQAASQAAARAASHAATQAVSRAAAQAAMDAATRAASHAATHAASQAASHAATHAAMHAAAHNAHHGHAGGFGGHPGLRGS